MPRRSNTELVEDFSAAMIVRAIDVQINADAITQVTLPNAVAAARPDMTPPPPPPPLPIPRPPPSERCISTTPIRDSAKRRWMIRTTFSIGTCLSKRVMN